MGLGKTLISKIGEAAKALPWWGKIALGTAIVGGVTTYNALKPFESGKPFSPPPSAIEVFDETFQVDMYDDAGKLRQNSPRIRVYKDEPTDTVYLSARTRDFNRQSWKGNTPYFTNHACIHNNSTRLVVSTESGIRIENVQQQAYMVPEYKWDTHLQKETLETLAFQEGGRIILEGGVEGILKGVPIKLKQAEQIKIARKNYQSFRNIVELFAENGREHQIAESQRTLPEWNITNIPFYTPQKFTQQRPTAIEYKLEFDLSELESNEQGVVALMFGMGLGNPSDEGHVSQGTFREGYGTTFPKSFALTLKKEGKAQAISKNSLEWYLLNQNELEPFRVLTKKELEGRESYFIGSDNMRRLTEDELNRIEIPIQFKLDEMIIARYESRSPLVSPIEFQIMAMKLKKDGKEWEEGKRQAMFFYRIRPNHLCITPSNSDYFVTLCLPWESLCLSDSDLEDFPKNIEAKNLEIPERVKDAFRMQRELSKAIVNYVERVQGDGEIVFRNREVLEDWEVLRETPDFLSEDPNTRLKALEEIKKIRRIH